VAFDFGKLARTGAIADITEPAALSGERAAGLVVAPGPQVPGWVGLSGPSDGQDLAGRAVVG